MRELFYTFGDAKKIASLAGKNSLFLLQRHLPST